MAGIAITRMGLTAVELRRAAGRSKDARAARAGCWRLRWCWMSHRRAIGSSGDGERPHNGGADLRDGPPDAAVRRVGKLSGGSFPAERGLRTNAEGVAGLVNRAVPQRPRRLVPGQLVALAAFGRGRFRPGARRRGALASP